MSPTSQAERLSAIINTTVDGIIVIDSCGLIESFNPAAERLFGYGEAEVIGKNVNVLMPSPFHEQHDGYLAHYRDTGEKKIIGVGREVRGRRKDGTIFPLHLSVGEMTINGERKFTGVVHDLTDRVALEERLREQSALVKLGEMAAVLAHEIKNPLAGIRGAVQVIGGRLPAESVDAQMMKEIVSRIDSLDAMMKDLLVYARPPKPQRTAVDVMRLLRETADLLARDQDATRLHIDIHGEPVSIHADPAMLKMVIHNLLINAAHAMQGHGRIDVQVGARPGWCRIAMTDSGPGIPDDVREKIFVPFFTTKRKGTGLGLPTAKRFVDAHDGRISVDNGPGGGTLVTIELPAGPVRPTAA
jgi:two-component system sensor kinase FixL